jgi:hypothetical protein
LGLETKCRYNVHKIVPCIVCILGHVILAVAASQFSGLLALGCLLLEEILIQKDTFSEAGSSKRSKILEPRAEDVLWLTLAE